ncbi:Acetyltransferase (GNAT) family protein [uncultured archaeon]|nr:Acetyltransferase (GNAT) family protein [uncultured archaeon]
MARVTRAGKEDFVEIHKLLLGIFPDAAANIGANDDFFVAKDPDVVGFAHYCEDKERIILKGFGVAEKYRKGGVGGLLLDRLVGYAKRKRKNVYLKAKVGNPALRLYCSKGFCFKRIKGETLTLVFRIAN